MPAPAAPPRLSSPRLPHHPRLTAAPSGWPAQRVPGRRLRPEPARAASAPATTRAAHILDPHHTSALTAQM